MAGLVIVLLGWIIAGQIAYQVCHRIEGPLDTAKEALGIRFLFSIATPISIVIMLVTVVNSNRSPVKQWLDSRPPRWL